MLNKALSRSELLSEQIYQLLKTEILNGIRRPGERIVETKVATELQTSRSPVREAIHLLQAEQLVVDKEGSMYVFNPTYEDFMEVYELRLALEPCAARIAAQSITRFQIEALAENLHQTKHALGTGKIEDLIGLNTKFHRTIWEACGNRRFYRILDNVSVLIHYYCYLVLKLNRQQTNIIQEHQMILDALSHHDSEQAERTMIAHVEKDLAVIARAYELMQGVERDIP